jgi:hypothetical protein
MHISQMTAAAAITSAPSTYDTRQTLVTNNVLYILVQVEALEKEMATLRAHGEAEQKRLSEQAETLAVKLDAALQKQ